MIKMNIPEEKEKNNDTEKNFIENQHLVKQKIPKNLQD